MTDSLAETLRVGLLGLIGFHKPEAADLTIEGIARAGAGNSTENWFFDARWREECRPIHERLILRRAPENEIVVTARADEFALLQALDGTDAHAPRAYWIDADGQWLGRPAMVLERRSGRADRGLLTAKNGLGLDGNARVDLARQMADALAALHAIDVSALRLPRRLIRGEANPATRELDLQEEDCRRQEIEPSVELRLAAWWLRDNVPPPPARRVLVHGDFRPANLLVEGGRITTILDWELAHVGDPAEDLGWHLASYYRGEHLIEGLWTAEDFLRRYESVAGVGVDRAAVRFWAQFAHYKLAGIALATISAFRKGDASRVAVPPRNLLTLLLGGVADENGMEGG
jgi:aminoglycoside phosphotransferase (APT) family kinase protein